MSSPQGEPGTTFKGNFTLQGIFILETDRKKKKQQHATPISLVKHFYTMHFIWAAAFELLIT